MLKNIGIAIIVLGSLAGSLVSIMDPEKVPWLLYGVCLAVGAAGVGLVQWATRRAATDASALAGQMTDVRESVEILAQRSAELSEGFVADGSVYDLPTRIDAIFPDPVTRFVEAREALVRVHGVQVYADIMGDFAAGERYLNRVWSAAAEGYVDEAQTYLEKAARQLALTRDAVARLPR